jgi:YARHG domain
LPGSCWCSRPARANCYELFGCTNSDYCSDYYKASQLKQASCQIVWEMRNQIYKENGYCLRTLKAIDTFGNTGCVHDDVADVPLNNAKQHNVSAIQEAEAANGC